MPPSAENHTFLTNNSHLFSRFVIMHKRGYSAFAEYPRRFFDSLNTPKLFKTLFKLSKTLISQGTFRQVEGSKPVQNLTSGEVFDRSELLFAVENKKF